MSYTPLPGDPCSAGYAPFPEMWFSPFPEECLDDGQPIPPTPDNYEEFQWGSVDAALAVGKSWMVSPPYQLGETQIRQAMVWNVAEYQWKVEHVEYTDSEAEDPEQILTEENTLWAGLGSGSFVETHDFYSSNDHWGWIDPRSNATLWIDYGTYNHNFVYTHTVVWDSYYQQWKHTYKATWTRYYSLAEWHFFKVGKDFDILDPDPIAYPSGDILFQVEQDSNEIVESVTCQVLGPEFHDFALSSTVEDEEVWEASQGLTYNGNYTATFTTEYLWFSVIKSVQFSIINGTDPPERISGSIPNTVALFMLMLMELCGGIPPTRNPRNR